MDPMGAVGAWVHQDSENAKVVGYNSSQGSVVATLPVEPQFQVYAVNGREVVLDHDSRQLRLQQTGCQDARPRSPGFSAALDVS